MLRKLSEQVHKDVNEDELDDVLKPISQEDRSKLKRNKYLRIEKLRDEATNFIEDENDSDNIRDIVKALDLTVCSLSDDGSISAGKDELLRFIYIAHEADLEYIVDLYITTGHNNA